MRMALSVFYLLGGNVSEKSATRRAVLTRHSTINFGFHANLSEQ